MGKVSRVFKTVRYSATQQEQPVFRDALRFVRVEQDGEVVMTFRTQEVRGKPWSPLAGPNIGRLPLSLSVLQTSHAEQWADIEFESWTNHPRQ